MTVDNYKDFYHDRYGKMPSDKLIESFCKLNSIPWPPKKPEKEEIPYWAPPKADIIFGGEIEG